METRPLPTALYCRLSREDGDRMESDSIGNQRKLLEEYIENHPELVMAECYADDGYTGTNFLCSILRPCSRSTRSHI